MGQTPFAPRLEFSSVLAATTLADPGFCPAQTKRKREREREKEREREREKEKYAATDSFVSPFSFVKAGPLETSYCIMQGES